jgi:hypothetical protein
MACKDIAASNKELGDDHPWWETDCLLDVVDIEWLETAYPSIAARIAEKTNGQFSD